MRGEIHGMEAKKNKEISWSWPWIISSLHCESDCSIICFSWSVAHRKEVMKNCALLGRGADKRDGGRGKRGDIEKEGGVEKKEDWEIMGGSEACNTDRQAHCWACRREWVGDSLRTEVGHKPNTPAFQNLGDKQPTVCTLHKQWCHAPALPKTQEDQPCASFPYTWTTSRAIPPPFLPEPKSLGSRRTKQGKWEDQEKETEEQRPNSRV